MVVEVAPLILWRGWGLAESVYSPPPIFVVCETVLSDGKHHGGCRC